MLLILIHFIHGNCSDTKENNTQVRARNVQLITNNGPNISTNQSKARY